MEPLIMIVDDARFARNLSKKALNNGGYTNLIEATNAADAVQLFQERNPDLVLLDITLTDCTDLTLLKSLLEIRPDAKIIMNSAIGQELIISDALEIGALDFITKPFEEEMLLSIVGNALYTD